VEKDEQYQGKPNKMTLLKGNINSRININFKQKNYSMNH